MDKTRSSQTNPGRIHVKNADVFKPIFSFSKLLVVLFVPVSVEELVSVEDAPSARLEKHL